MSSRAPQPLSYDLRLPDETQTDALRLLDASRAVINQVLTTLWPRLDEFTTERSGPAWKHVDALLDSPAPHGSRQWRCEAEVAGRVLRAQAERKRAFAQVLPMLNQGFIRPPTGKRPAGKRRSAISQAITALQAPPDADDTSFVALQNVIEQACNYFLHEDRFPTTYDELQPLPVLRAGLLSYAGDDGGDKGQAYRLALDLDAGEARFRFRFPDPHGVWQWGPTETSIPLPACLRARLRAGARLLAPTLREVRRSTGERYAVLDFPLAVPSVQPLPAWGAVGRVLGVDWGVHTLLTATAVDAQSQQVGRPFFLDTGGFDGHQARTRRQIDQLKKKVSRYERERDALPADHPKRAWYAKRIQALLDEVTRCWRKYNRRNRAVAHLASNAILLLCRVHGCSLLAMESLTTLKSTGRGKSVKGRWRNFRNNTTIRGEIWRLLRYKCLLAGIRFRTIPPRGTSHTCPHCGQAAQTYRSPTARHEAVDWGRWLWCARCGFNADRDYCAALNIARVGVTYLTQMQATSTAKLRPVSDPSVKPVSYTRTGAVLLLPPPGSHARPQRAGKITYYPGWLHSAFLQSSQPKAAFLRLCG